MSEEDKNISNRLSIQTGLNGFSFCIGSTSALPHHVSALSLPIVYPIEDSSLPAFTLSIDNDTSLKGSFSEVKWLVDTPWYTIVPKPYFNPENIEKELSLHYGPAISQCNFGYEKLNSYEAFLVYAKPGKLGAYIEDLWGKDIYIRHTAAITFEKMVSWAITSLPSDKTGLSIIIRGGDMVVSAFNGGKLLFFNRFLRIAQSSGISAQYSYPGHEDEPSLLYYIVSVLNFLKLDKNEVSLRIASPAPLPLIKSYLPENNTTIYTQYKLPEQYSTLRPDAFFHLLCLDI